MRAAHPWLKTIVESAPVRSLVDALAPLQGPDPKAKKDLTRSDAEASILRGVAASGSRGGSTHLLAGALAQQMQRPVLLVVAHLDEADDALDDLELFSQADMPLTAERFGALEVLPGESSVNMELLAERLGVVERVAAGRMPNVIVAPIQALMQAVPDQTAIGAFALTLEQGMELPPNELVAWLDRAGYQRQEAIDEPGDFALRGGILDLYPPAGSVVNDQGEPDAIGPIRIDYFGDEIDTLCRIGGDHVSSGEKLRAVRVVGASADMVQSDLSSQCLIDLLPPDVVVIMHETMELTEQARGYYERLTKSAGVFASNTTFQKLLRRPHVEVNEYSPVRTSSKESAAVEMPVNQLVAFDTDAKAAIAELADLACADGHAVHVLCNKPAERDRFVELIQEQTPHAAKKIQVELGALHHGFVWGHGDLGDGTTHHLVPHSELFHRYETRRRVRKVAAGTSGAGEKTSDAFLDLDVGDYVVHVDHGIAQFVGLKHMRREGKSREYLTLEFADKALLHVPADQIDLVQKYIGGFQGRPPLSTLGGKRWQKQKEQVAEAVKDLAAELLRVQAARETQPGVRYPDDTLWQKEFEAEFPYDETEDQLAAIAAIKHDLARDRPMDRLVCGDVGFGKTEVAIRGAFKVVESGKQVAVLVPTTVLAEQHERTFKQRLADYPFTVESLSRFKTMGEAREILKRVALGKVDVLIGTHRILSEDVEFKDLGMVIVDEEQRFGVEHKNKLLQCRLTAEVLTLTATPIPRTLHMSMIGLRDISSLSTAPVDRRAIVTEVIPYNERRIQQALVRELNRDGQCYFVHNRVHNIQSVADRIQKLVPDARIVIGHGQMSPRELEKVMLQFMRRKADILVSTTIIESGIDNPTANTMFVNQANHFGLAELHQLRGRVGRYKHRAYCYLLLPEDRTISEVAAKRLKAIESYSMLGAGFKIAMRDLEIRGAGNLLGAEQSGHIATVGYEMYCTLLEHATKRLQNLKIIEPSKTHLELPVAGAIPKRYITSDKYRMEAYRRLGRATTLAEYEDVVQGLQDAYGKPPETAQALFDLAELRIGASTLGIERIKLEEKDLIFTVEKSANLSKVFEGAPGRVSVLDAKTVYYRPPENYLKPASTLLAVLRKLIVRPVQKG